MSARDAGLGIVRGLALCQKCHDVDASLPYLDFFCDAMAVLLNVLRCDTAAVGLTRRARCL